MSHLIQALHMPLTLPVMQRPRTGRKPAATGEGQAEKGTRRGARRLALCGPGTALPLSLPSRSGRLGPLQPRASTLRIAQNNRYKLRHHGAEFPGRPAPSSGSHRAAAPTCAPPLGGAPVTGVQRPARSRPAALALRGRGAPGPPLPASLSVPTSEATGRPPTPAQSVRSPARPLAGPRPLASLT